MATADVVKVDELADEQLQRITEDILRGKMTLQEVKGFSDADVEAIYSVGHSLYMAARYDEARPVFNWLVLLNPYKGKYWLGLAACQQLMKDYEKALTAYALTAMTSAPRDPVPHFHAGECSLAMNKPEDAAKAFAMAVDFGKGRSQYDRLTRKAEALLGLIKKGDTRG
jgi:type III secretion system low calcium response chaperone LcrH/SycD